MAMVSTRVPGKCTCVCVIGLLLSVNASHMKHPGTYLLAPLLSLINQACLWAAIDFPISQPSSTSLFQGRLLVREFGREARLGGVLLRAGCLAGSRHLVGELGLEELLGLVLRAVGAVHARGRFHG